MLVPHFSLGRAEKTTERRKKDRKKEDTKETKYTRDEEEAEECNVVLGVSFCPVLPLPHLPCGVSCHCVSSSSLYESVVMWVVYAGSVELPLSLCICLRGGRQTSTQSAE